MAVDFAAVYRGQAWEAAYGTPFQRTTIVYTPKLMYPIEVSKASWRPLELYPKTKIYY